MDRLEFLRWQVFLDQEARDEFDREWKYHHRSDWYMAQIAFHVYLLRWSVDHMFAKKVTQPDLEFKDFFIKNDNDKKKSVAEMTPEEVAEAKERASRWAMARHSMSFGVSIGSRN